MASNYRIRCTVCDFRREGALSQTVVNLDNRTETVCLAGREVETAMDVTGRLWYELVSEGRILYRYGLVCLKCGALDYYGPDQLHQEPLHQIHHYNMVHHPSPGEASFYACRHCGTRSLYPLCGDAGQQALLRYPARLLSRVIRCPNCRPGHLRSEQACKNIPRTTDWNDMNVFSRVTRSIAMLLAKVVS